MGSPPHPPWFWVHLSHSSLRQECSHHPWIRFSQCTQAFWLYVLKHICFYVFLSLCQWWLHVLKYYRARFFSCCTITPQNGGGLVLVESVQSLCYYGVLSQRLHFKQQSAVRERHTSLKMTSLNVVRYFWRPPDKILLFLKGAVTFKIAWAFCPWNVSSRLQMQNDFI